MAELGSRGVDLGHSLRPVFYRATEQLREQFVCTLPRLSLSPSLSLCLFPSFCLLGPPFICLIPFPSFITHFTIQFKNPCYHFESFAWSSSLLHYRVTTAQGLLVVPRSRLRIKGAWLYAFEVVAPKLCKSVPQVLISADTFKKAV